MYKDAYIFLVDAMTVKFESCFYIGDLFKENRCFQKVCSGLNLEEAIFNIMEE